MKWWMNCSSGPTFWWQSALALKKLEMLNCTMLVFATKRMYGKMALLFLRPLPWSNLGWNTLRPRLGWRQPPSLPKPTQTFWEGSIQWLTPRSGLEFLIYRSPLFWGLYFKPKAFRFFKSDQQPKPGNCCSHRYLLCNKPLLVSNLAGPKGD